MPDGSRSLFAFVLHHPVTGGLSWLRSSDLVELDMAAGRALTSSGRRYVLGRQFRPSDIGTEGEEAVLAFDALIGSRFRGADRMPPLTGTDLRWLAAQKIARHLNVRPPGHDSAEVDRFIASKMADYIARRKVSGQE